MTKNNSDLLKRYKDKVKKNKAEKSGIQPVKSFEFEVPKNINAIKVKVFDSLNIGANGKNTCSINELINHITDVVWNLEEVRLQNMSSGIQDWIK